MSQLLKISFLAIAMMFVVSDFAEAAGKPRGEVRRVSRRVNRRQDRRADRKEDKAKDTAPAANAPTTPEAGAAPAGQ
jgi:hypothetical protein